MSVIVAFCMTSTQPKVCVHSCVPAYMCQKAYCNCAASHWTVAVVIVPNAGYTDLSTCLITQVSVWGGIRAYTVTSLEVVNVVVTATHYCCLSSAPAQPVYMYIHMETLNAGYCVIVTRE